MAQETLDIRLHWLVVETWVHQFQSGTKQQLKQWKLFSTSLPSEEAKAVPAAGKVMALVFWDQAFLILKRTASYWWILTQPNEAVEKGHREKLTKDKLFHLDSPLDPSLMKIKVCVASQGLLPLNGQLIYPGPDWLGMNGGSYNTKTKNL